VAEEVDAGFMDRVREHVAAHPFGCPDIECDICGHAGLHPKAWDLGARPENQNFFTENAKRSRDDFYTHVRPEMRALAERPERVTWVEHEALRANSYERRLIVQNLDDDALCRLYEWYVQNSKPALREFELAVHYGDGVQRELAPLLVKRLREKIS
jgi:hypothetical protein